MNIGRTHSKKSRFEAIYTTHYVRLYYFALHIIDNDDACKDLLSDVFANLWNHLDEVDDSNIKSYLFSAVHNHAVDLMRREMRQTLYNEEYLREAELYYSEMPDNSDTDRLVAQMFAQLSPPTDQILRMCYLQRMKYAEVAEALQISTSTVKKHVSKALKILRELYKDKKDTRFS